MQTSSAVLSTPDKGTTPARFFNCVLNDNWSKALEGKRFYVGQKTERYSSWSSYTHTRHGIKDRKDKSWFIEFSGADSLQCCGITELNFEYLYAEAWDTYKNDPDWDQLVALYIWETTGKPSDERILVAGLPTENSNGHDSQYNFTFYNKVLKTLLSFGFKQSGKKYVNNNSKNVLRVLVGQLPPK